MGFVRRLPGATPKSLFGIDSPQAAILVSLIQAMSSPTVQTFQPSNPAANQHREVFLPQSAGNARSRRFLTLRILAPTITVLGHPTFISSDV